MPLARGERLGPYEVLAPLGAGGMGEVYHARDSRLGREVAIKVLPDAFARDAERLARFEREAQLLASLNHPNIAAIYGLEEYGGVRCLILEYVPGETLAERLGRGPLPLDDALEVCRQVADALEAAHERTIVHRDLKPANIKVTPEGKVKVLDFGLAKEVAAAAGAASQAATMTALAETRAGVILGTAAYMSPEQARGKPVDKRADIWAFGCVLYECLAGRQAFGGETLSDSVAGILTAEPGWRALPAEVPATLRGVLERCLRKDPRRRFHDMGDVRVELEEPLSPPAAAAAAPAGVRTPRWMWSALAALAIMTLLCASLALWMVIAKPDTPAALLTRFTIHPPQGMELLQVAISRDGRRVAFSAMRPGASGQVFLRALDQPEPTPVAGTESGRNPFFSPDGQSLGFFDGGKLRKVALTGGMPTTIAEAQIGSASWAADNNTILFTPRRGSGVFLVSAEGGVPQALTTPDKGKGEEGHYGPEMLPGRKAIVFTIGKGRRDEGDIGVYRLGAERHEILISNGTSPHYLPTGHMVFTRSGTLHAAPFDAASLTAGTPAPMTEGVSRTGIGQFAISDNGVLVYAPWGVLEASRSLLWVDRRGGSQPITAGRAFRHPRVSPDGRRVAMAVELINESDVWTYDIERGVLTRVTLDGRSYYPVWTSDGRRLVYVSTKTGSQALFVKSLDGGEEQLPAGQKPGMPTSVAVGDRWLAFGAGDIWVLPLQGGGAPRPLLDSKFDETGAAFSPDGSYIAYFSNESGRSEVYVQAFPGPGGKLQISNEGGSWPVWSRDGRELFYRAGKKVMAVAISTRPALKAGRSAVLFEGPYSDRFDVMPDGRRFVMVKSEQEILPTQVNVVLNWFEELRRRGVGKR